MCDVCRQTPCASACPNAPEPPIFARCHNCGTKIYDGDDYYNINDEYWCEDCIEERHKTAEVDYV